LHELKKSPSVWEAEAVQILLSIMRHENEDAFLKVNILVPVKRSV
jgi:hypothetical protein